MSAQKPNTNKVIDYWLSWFDWQRKSLESYNKGGAKERVDVINIAFALPQQDGTLKWNDIDKSQGGNYQKTKDLIKELRTQGKHVLIAVGGATANDWNLNTAADIKKLAENIKKFVDEYDLNGVDIDYEKTEPKEREKLADLIIELRKLMPQNQYVLSYAAWSIGAYGKENPGHEHPEWAGGNSGIDVNILKKIGHLLDYVNIMSYDAFDPAQKYNPIEAIEAYKSLMNGNANKVILGLELGPHAWPQNVMTSTKDVQPWIEYTLKNGFGGVMFWALEYDSGEKKNTKEAEGAFLALCSQLMPKAGISHGSATVPATLKSGGLDTSNLKEKEISAAATGIHFSSVGSAAKPIFAAPDIKQSQDKPVNPINPAIHLHYNAEKHKSEPKEEDIYSKLGISDLQNSSKVKIVGLYQKNALHLAHLKQNFSNQQAKRNEQIKEMKAITPEQIEGLKKHYEIQDKIDTDSLLSVEKALNDQLNHYIKQLRDAAPQKPSL